MRPVPVTILVHGIPAPQGSKRAVRNQSTGRIALVEMSKAVVPWRQDVALAALAVVNEVDGWPYDGPVRLELEFWLPRPKGHYRTGRYADQLRLEAPAWPAGRPDVDKLARSTLDALTGVVVDDDAQCVSLTVVKRYLDRGMRPGCQIEVDPLPPFFPFDPAPNLA